MTNVFLTVCTLGIVDNLKLIVLTNACVNAFDWWNLSKKIWSCKRGLIVCIKSERHAISITQVCYRMILILNTMQETRLPRKKVPVGCHDMYSIKEQFIITRFKHDRLLFSFSNTNRTYFVMFGVTKINPTMF